MPPREGSLAAPMRHPLGWRAEGRHDPAFYDPAALDQELARVFGICHGCRRCVSLCTAFPTLFDLVDAGPTGELDGVARADYGKVVERCYLCDLCFMTKCPYVPPHEWNVDFPHLMLRAKALRYRQGRVRARDRILAATDVVGRLASLPGVNRLANFSLRNRLMRRALDRVLAVHRERRLPGYARPGFRRRARPAADFPIRDGARSPGKVALFATCYVNYNEPGIGHDLLAILAHNRIPARIVEREVCCGMPRLELGDLDGVARQAARNLPVLARLAAEGHALLTCVPSCTLMFKQELPLLLPDDPAARAVRAAMYDPFEYLMLRHRDGLLETDFRHPLGTVSYHVPCHLRVQNLGLKTRDALALAGARVQVVERCSGHDGTWGVKREFYPAAMRIGRPVFRQMAQGQPAWISSDCAIAARHIEQGMADAAAQKAHPLTLFRLAYGV